MRKLMTATLLLAGLAVLPSAQPRDQLRDHANLTFTSAEIAAITSLGPWPPPWKPDVSNRVSGHPDAMMLGRLLFFDARLSGLGTHACSSCHQPERSWTDGRATAQGLSPGVRNTPGLFDVRYRRWFGWDGAADSLWAQSLRPIMDAREMGSSAEHVHAHITRNTEVADLYAKVFRRSAHSTPAEDVLVDAAKALAAFQETLVSARTSFDIYRDALARGMVTTNSDLSASARRGLRLFLGNGGCIQCHSGPAFTSDAFAKLEQNPTVQNDPGRWGGVERLLQSPFTLHGRLNDDAAQTTAWDKKRIMPSAQDNGAFRVPTVRNLKSSAPYMHDGARKSLHTAIQAHASPISGAGSERTATEQLTEQEIGDLVAFLECLSP